MTDMEVAMHAVYPEDIENNLTLPMNGSMGAVSSLALKVSWRDQYYPVSLFLSCLYTIFLFPVGFFGNTLILFVNLSSQGRLTAPDMYFVNLAVADLMLVADSLIEVFNLKEGYYENVALCTFMSLFQQVNMHSSVFFLTWMSFDRFMALTGTVGRNVPHARISCSLIWVSSSFLTVVPFAVAQAQHPGDLHFCVANVSQILWLKVMLGFLAPLCILSLCYWRIAQVLLRSQVDHGGLQRPPRRQKALRMISAAVLVFFICWLPENVFVSVHLLRGPANGSTLWQDYPLTAHIVNLAAFSNSCLNPLIYSFLGETFQDKLKLLLGLNVRWTKLDRTTSVKSPSLRARNM